MTPFDLYGDPDPIGEMYAAMPRPSRPNPRPSRPVYLVGLDLGQSADYSALAILERTYAKSKPVEGKPCRLESHYAVRHLTRWPLGTPYPAIVADVVALCERDPLPGCHLVIDQTGCGRAVVDMFTQAKPKARITPMLITAGNAVTFTDASLHVAKVQLVSTMQALLQGERIKFAPVEQREVLIRELTTFKVKITAAGNESFESWRERDHDDLCFAVMMAAFLGERETPSVPPRVLTPGVQLPPAISQPGLPTGPGFSPGLPGFGPDLPGY